MVIHDESRMQIWIEEQEKQQQPPEARPKRSVRLSVVAVQSIACCVAVLLVLLLRVAGGESYGVVRRQFQQMLARNEWATAVAWLWQDRPLEMVEKTVEDDVKVDGFTVGESAQLTGSSAIVAAVPPLASGTLTSTYGERVHPIHGQQEFHNGVDIAAPQGAALAAMYDGEVIEVGENDSIGRYVRLRHEGGIEVLYGHCESIVAQQGELVKAGETVALVGSTGVSTGSHVHLSVKVDGEVCNPAALFSLKNYA